MDDNILILQDTVDDNTQTTDQFNKNFKKTLMKHDFELIKIKNFFDRCFYRQTSLQDKVESMKSQYIDTVVSYKKKVHHWMVEIL